MKGCGGWRGFADEVVGDKVGAVGHGVAMRWVLMLFVILAAVMGGEARAVVVMGRVVMSERVGRAEAGEMEAEALLGASREVVPEVEEAAGLVGSGPLECWFPGGSAVARSDCGAGQSGARPIEEVGLGDRVRTAEAGAPQDSGTAVMDPASWRAYSLRMTRADGTVTRVDLLRPAGWEQVMTQGPDGRRTIHLELPEMGVSGEAEVLAVSPCPPLEPGVGRVVTGSFRNERNHGLRALHVSVAGEVSCLRVTSGHPVWSVTRGAWIGAGDLVPGEALAAWRGETVAVLANLPEADTATWNLEVENEHVYRVGPAGILGHNTCPTPKELFEGGGAGAAKTTVGAADDLARGTSNFAKPAPTNPTIANMFKAPRAAALEARAGLSAAEREMWARHYADVAARTKNGPAIKLNVERAKFLRGETDLPPGNILDHQ
jgi:hypothetical protein